MSLYGRVVAALVLLAVVVAVSVWVFWFRPEAAEVVSLEEAVEDVASSVAGEPLTAAGDAEDELRPQEAASPANELAGTWRVEAAAPGDPQKGEGTFAGYRIEEELANVGANTATGRTDAVDGEVEIVDGRVAAAAVRVDLTGLTSDQDLRDRALATRGLEYERYPAATFELTSPAPVDLDRLAGGEAVPVEVTGALTLHGRTNVEVFPLEAQLVGDRLVVVGSTRIRLEDYAIERPTGFRVLDIAETGVVELQLILRHDAAS